MLVDVIFTLEQRLHSFNACCQPPCCWCVWHNARRLQETLRTMFEIAEEAAVDPLPSRAGSPYGSLLRWGQVGDANWFNARQG